MFHPCVLTLLAAFLACVSLTRAAPVLSYTDTEGQVFRIVGQRHVVGMIRPFYEDAQGEAIYLTSLAGVALEANEEDIRQYGILASDYLIQRVEIQGRSSERRALRLSPLAFSDAIDRNTEPASSENLLYLVTWVEGERLTPLALARPSMLGTVIALPESISIGDSGTVAGYPCLFIYERGEALRPKPGSLTSAHLLEAEISDEGLIAAALNGDREYLQPRLQREATEREDLYEKLLHAATLSGRPATTELILDRMLEASESRQLAIPQSLIEQALRNGQQETLLAILRHPIFQSDRPAKRADGLVSLAVKLQRFQIADALQAQGYPFKASKEDLPDLLRSCFSHNRLDYVRQIETQHRLKRARFQQWFEPSAYHHVARTAQSATLEYLSQYDIPIDLEDSHNYTPLILAAGYGNIPAVCWFLEKGARINHRNSSGHTALQYAIVNQQQEAAACLIEQGPDINLIGPEGVTPLMQAVLFRDAFAAHEIARAGGIWNLDSPYLGHCLNYALKQDLDEILAVALQQGLSPGYMVYEEWPLHWLATYYRAARCQRLLGSDPQLSDDSMKLLASDLSLQRYSRIELEDVASHETLPASASFTCLVNRRGETSLVWLKEPTDRFLENDLRNFISTLSFSVPSSLTSGDGVLALLEARLELRKVRGSLEASVSPDSISVIEVPNRGTAVDGNR